MLGIYIAFMQNHLFALNFIKLVLTRLHNVKYFPVRDNLHNIYPLTRSTDKLSIN